MDFQELPTEIVASILEYAMAYDEPLHLQHFIDLGRMPHPPDPAWDDLDVDYHFRTHLSSKDWWFEHLEPSQKIHFIHWLLVNSTCQRFRVFGKPAFFSQKNFVITPNLLRGLEGQQVRNMAVADQSMALFRISQVVTPFGRVSAGASFIGLKRYQRLLPRLSNIDIYTYDPRYAIMQTLKEASTHAPPQKLRNLLREVGLDPKRIHVSLLYPDDEDSRQEQVAGLCDNVYPFLQVLADRKAKMEV